MLWFAAAGPALSAAHIDNSCVFARDGVCDERRYAGTGRCPDGTDFDDCARFGQSCPWVRNGDCDERVPWGVGRCAIGTDLIDCANANPGPDSCQYAYNRTCDHPGVGTGLCPPNTDQTDCGAAQRPAPATAASAQPDPLVAPIQAELTILGYAPGPIDGVPGPATRAASERAQRDLGLRVTGVASQDLLEALRRRAAATDAPPYVPTPVRPSAVEAPVYEPQRVRPRAEGTVPVAPAPSGSLGAPRPIVPSPAAPDAPDGDSPQPAPGAVGAGNESVQPRDQAGRDEQAARRSELEDELARLLADVERLRAEVEVLELRQEIADLRSESAELREELGESTSGDGAGDDAGAGPAVAEEIARLRAAIAARDSAIAALQRAVEAVTVVE